MNDPNKDTDEYIRRREQLAALGKQSAGLAHELNNPASAVLRAVQQLQNDLADERMLYRNIADIWANDESRLHVEGWVERIKQRVDTERGHGGASLRGVQRVLREDNILEWLGTRHIREAWRIGPALADAFVNAVDLDDLAEGIGRTRLDAVLDWVASALVVDSMIQSAQQSAKRVTELVTAISSYSRMDAAEMQEIEIHHGIEESLQLLEHRFTAEDGFVTLIHRNYEPNLPRIRGYAGELKQVWTNLLDNALDAVQLRTRSAQNPPEASDAPCVTIRTGREGEHVLVEIIDNGPGIPPEILPRVFDAFFTTKSARKGTGLGLEIAHQIVVRHHHGDLSVTSKPGKTRFQVRLPICTSDLPHVE